MPVKDSSLVVPSGISWNELQKIFPTLELAKIVYVSDDAPGFFFNEARTELTVKLPLPKVTTTAVCNGDGSITFTHEFS